MKPSPVPEILDELRAGRIIVLADDEKRENEGDLVVAAEKVTPEAINFMLTEGRGLLCLTLSEERAEELRLSPQTPDNTSTFGTNFTVSIDAKKGVTTGVSAADRARTILTAVSDDCGPDDLARPGHVLPIKARKGGVLVRTGQTEGSVDLARLAGLKPAGVICEIMNEDGTMARRPELAEFCRKHGLKGCYVDDVIRYRQASEKFVVRHPACKLPTAMGEFMLRCYTTTVDNSISLALTVGDVGESPPDQPLADPEPVPVRVHSQCFTGDVLLSLRCDCREQLHTAMKVIQDHGRGVVLYMSQEGRGIGLINKLHAYHLQDHGRDTVEANEELGFKADERDYGIGAQILHDLGIRRMRLLTNNPKKYTALSGYGLEIVERVPLVTQPRPENEAYLRAKKDKLGHIL